jgi:hypothetical protein
MFSGNQQPKTLCKAALGLNPVSSTHCGGGDTPFMGTSGNSEMKS